MLVDTHAHIHFEGSSPHGDGYADAGEVIDRARAAGVEKILCVGVDDQDSKRTVEFVAGRDNLWATVGLHPHEASRGVAALSTIAELADRPQVVAIGECGLDYFRNLSTPADQQTAFRFQIELALKNNLPMVWHVRDSFDDFFKIIDDYPGVRGVVHCFTGTSENMQKAVERGFYIALNGIMTFTKDAAQLGMARAVPLDRLVLETDCPFLAPVPHRGQRNEPAYLADTARFLAGLRGESFDELSKQTTANAERIFGLP